MEEELSKEKPEEIHQALRDLRSPTKLRRSSWRSSCLVSQRLRDTPGMTEHQAIKSVFEDVLRRLQAEETSYADLLRGRYWEGWSVNKMVVSERPIPLAERTFYNYQEQAVQQFALLLVSMERACVQSSQATITSNEEVTASQEALTQASPAAKPWPIYSFRIALLIVIGVIIIGLVSIFVFRTQNITTSPTNNASLCGAMTTSATLDSKRFLRSQGVIDYSVENTQGAVLNNHIRAVSIDQRGLWIGYFSTSQNQSNGLRFYDKKSWANCDRLGVTNGKDINAIITDHNGQVWIATEKGGVVLFDGQEFHTYTERDGLPSDQTYGLAVDKNNNIWVGTWGGIARFDGKNWSNPYTVENGSLVNNHVHAIAIDNDNNIWIGYIDRGVSEFRAVDNAWVHYQASPDSLGGNQIRGIVVRKAPGETGSSMWFATEDGGVSKFEGGKWTVYHVKDGLPSEQVRAVAVDSLNRVWAATTKGVVYFDGATWRIYDTIDTLSIAFGLKCGDCPYNEDTVVTGTEKSGYTYSRLPLPTDAISVISIAYPKVVAPGEVFRPEITVSPNATFELREDKGDYLSNADESEDTLFGAYPIMKVKGTIAAGEKFTFTDFDNPFKAPPLAEGEQEKTFTSTWRIWMHTRYVNPPIHITFTVRRNQPHITPNK